METRFFISLIKSDETVCQLRGCHARIPRGMNTFYDLSHEQPTSNGTHVRLRAQDKQV